MRKRTFWGLLTVQTKVSGKLGRPMPLRLDDFDVELPEPIDDELLSEKGLDTSKPGKCLLAWQHLRLCHFTSRYIPPFTLFEKIQDRTFQICT
jgi:hypothetical protein